MQHVQDGERRITFNIAILTRFAMSVLGISVKKNPSDLEVADRFESFDRSNGFDSETVILFLFDLLVD